ncbi:MAG: HAMP domain-containing sensor histidine kinase, partial [Bacteroidota bacterium]
GSGEVLLMNKALQRMLRRPYVQHINGFRYLGDTFSGVLGRIQPGERELVKLRMESELLQLAVRATEFKLQQDPYLLVSFQNIRGELEARDLEAWQQLIRILTHEIMNSVTPVVSLTGTLQEMFEDEEALEDPELLTDAREGLSAIKNRGLGLIRFTEAYRDLTRLPEPEIEEVSAKELVHRVLTLFRPKFNQAGVEYQVQESSQELRLQVDPQLIEQVLINLIKNAIEALEGVIDPRITISYGKEGSRAMLAIQDNGPGIPEEVLERIFVPFYTTKSSGSGIGLSLSRQVMQKHKGSLSVNSSLGQGTTFILTL